MVFVVFLLDSYYDSVIWHFLWLYYTIEQPLTTGFEPGLNQSGFKDNLLNFIKKKNYRFFLILKSCIYSEFKAWHFTLKTLWSFWSVSCTHANIYKLNLSLFLSISLSHTHTHTHTHIHFTHLLQVQAEWSKKVRVIYDLFKLTSRLTMYSKK